MAGLAGKILGEKIPQKRHQNNPNKLVGNESYNSPVVCMFSTKMDDVLSHYKQERGAIKETNANRALHSQESSEPQDSKSGKLETTISGKLCDEDFNSLNCIEEQAIDKEPTVIIESENDSLQAVAYVKQENLSTNDANEVSSINLKFFNDSEMKERTIHTVPVKVKHEDEINIKEEAQDVNLKRENGQNGNKSEDSEDSEDGVPSALDLSFKDIKSGSPEVVDYGLKSEHKLKEEPEVMSQSSEKIGGQKRCENKRTHDSER